MLNLGRSDPTAKPTFENGLFKDGNQTIQSAAQSKAQIDITEKADNSSNRWDVDSDSV